MEKLTSELGTLSFMQSPSKAIGSKFTSHHVSKKLVLSPELRPSLLVGPSSSIMLPPSSFTMKMERVVVRNDAAAKNSLHRCGDDAEISISTAHYSVCEWANMWEVLTKNTRYSINIS